MQARVLNHCMSCSSICNSGTSVVCRNGMLSCTRSTSKLKTVPDHTRFIINRKRLVIFKHLDRQKGLQMLSFITGLNGRYCIANWFAYSMARHGLVENSAGQYSNHYHTTIQIVAVITRLMNDCFEME